MAESFKQQKQEREQKLIPDVFHCLLRFPTRLLELLLLNTPKPPAPYRPYFKPLYTAKDATPWMWLRAALDVFKENRLPYKGSSPITTKIDGKRITVLYDYVIEGIDFKLVKRDMEKDPYSFDTIITVRSTVSKDNLFEEVKADRLGFFCMGDTTMDEKSQSIEWMEINGIILKIL